jgi:hypothetical protein
VLGALADKAERGDVPEGGRAAVAEDDLIALRETEQVGQTFADLTHEVPDRGLAVRGSEHRTTERGQVGDLLGANLAGPAAESTVLGQELGGDGQRGGVSHEESPQGESGGHKTRPGTVGRSHSGQSVSHDDLLDLLSEHWDVDLNPRTGRSRIEPGSTPRTDQRA